MCNAFSCIVDRTKKVTWKFGVDSHDKLLEIAGLPDDTKDPKTIKFCRVEISPENKDYLNPDKWVFKIDMDITPAWWSLDHKRACESAHKEWMDQLYKILVRKTIVHPFKITPPRKITKEHIDLLKVWDSVWDSVGASVRASVGDSVGDSVWDSVGDSVWDSVWDSVRASVWDSVWVYISSFFQIEKWEYIEHTIWENPFQPAIDLWESGLVPSFDGTKWRLHGKNGKTIWEGVI